MTPSRPYTIGYVQCNAPEHPLCLDCGEEIESEGRAIAPVRSAMPESPSACRFCGVLLTARTSA